jgi:hypothetical protein
MTIFIDEFEFVTEVPSRGNIIWIGKHASLRE